jgi:hypothetical protein
MTKLEWGNVAQWLSALVALMLALLTINGFFFSRSSSQELVAYLQSELAVKNQRIAVLEARQHELELSAKTAQSSLGDVARQKAALEKQVADLNSQQQSFSRKTQELDSNLAKAEFSLVREKIGARLSSMTGRAIALRLVEEFDKPEGVRARTERPWDSHLSRIREIAEQLPERDRPLAKAVVANFVQQCSRLSGTAIQIPALRIPKDTDTSAYNNERDKTAVASRFNALTKQAEKLERDIDLCFLSVTP